MKRSSRAILEQLESRTLLSASVAQPPAAAISQPSSILHQPSIVSSLPSSPRGIGRTLRLTPNVEFTGEVAFLRSAVLDAPLTYAATVDWGDGTTSDATLQYNSQGLPGGYDIMGTHTYSTAGAFKITTTVVTEPIDPQSELPTTLVATIHGKAVVRDQSPPTQPRGIAEALHLMAGVEFTGEVAFLVTPMIDPPLKYAATIDWGDGTTSDATLQYNSQGSLAGFQIIGTHTYSAAGRHTINTTVVTEPIDPQSALPTTLVATIKSRAIVSGVPVNSDDGVTLNETAGTSFTADVGSFDAVPQANPHYRARILWGDGTSSMGEVHSGGAVGPGAHFGVSLGVAGTHTYAHAGTYAIRVAVRGIGGSVVARIESTAIVSTDATPVGTPISLAGTIAGTYTLAPLDTLTGPANETDYVLTGSGTAGDLGAVTLAGELRVPNLVEPGSGVAIIFPLVTGTLTLTNANGSVTLEVGPPFSAGAEFLVGSPTTLHYSVTSATGSYAGDGASGTLTVTLTPGATADDANTFTLTIN